MIQLSFDFDQDELRVKLAELEEALAKVLFPPPSRRTMLKWIDKGHLTGIQLVEDGAWYVTYGSARRLVERILKAEPGTVVFESLIIEKKENK